MKRRRSISHGSIEANLTSLIDVTFLLIVFFVLVSRLNEIEQIELDLPRPADAAASALESERQITINVVPAPGGDAAGYRVGVTDFSADQNGVQAMTAHLASLYQLNPMLDVNVRADRLTRYEHVEPVMHAISTAARGVLGASAQSKTMGHVNLAVIGER